MLVVTKGPVAIAGSMSNFLKTKGVKVPTPVAIIIDEQILKPTTTPIIGSVFKKRNPANNPSNIQSNILLFAIPFHKYNNERDQKGIRHTLTLNSGVVKL